MSTLVDQFGTRISSHTLYKTPSQRGGDFRPIAKPRAKTFEALSAYQRREQVDVSRVIAAGVPAIDTALTQAGEFSVGDSWHLKYRGRDKAWGKKRDDWFNHVYARDCNLRGSQSDWRSTLRQLNWTRKVQGDYGIVFDGQPSGVKGRETAPTGKFMVITFDRIGNGLDGAVKVGNGLEQCQDLGRDGAATYTSYGSWSGVYRINDPASPFDGYRLIDGVIVDGNLCVAGYRITGFNAAGQATYLDLPRQQLHFNFSARRQADQLRGIPELAEAIIPIMGLDDIQYLVTMAIKLASAMAVYRESTDGNPKLADRSNYDEEGTDAAGNSTTVKRSLQDMFPGIVELSVSNKEKMGVLNFNRPTMNEEAFIERVETSVLHKLWPRDLIYPASTGRAGARAIGIQANTICTWDQCCLERSARWIANNATAFSMRAGYVPGNDNLGDPYENVFTVPGKFTVDEGNDLKMRLQALGRCCISHGEICEADGYLWDEIVASRVTEIDRIMTEAEKLHQKHKAWDVRAIALMLDAGESNVSFSETQQPEKEEPDPEAEPANNGQRNGAVLQPGRRGGEDE